jgi:glucan phosphoethanolaminetransferase (alkaline phosphatase superfamily)
MDETIVVTSQPILSDTTTIDLDSSNTYSEKWYEGISVWSILRYILILVLILFLITSLIPWIKNKYDTNVVPTTTSKNENTFSATVSTSFDNAVNLMENSIGKANVKFNRIDDPNTTTQKAIQTALQSQPKKQTTPSADEAGSSTQQLQSRKSGYCYIGEDRGFRSCTQVGEGDTCMSGNIFPTNAICINPNLRE